MFAIQITEETLPKILQTPDLSVADAQAMCDVFLPTSDTTRYFIRGYYPDGAGEVGWTVFPDFIFEKNYDYNPEVVTHDWDQIVRL